jgi:hypothetical protein
MREPKRTELTEAGEPSILSKVVAVSAVQGVEQVCAGGWGGVAGERAGHILCRKQAMAASISNQRRVCSMTGNPRGGSSKPGGSASRQRKSVYWGGRRRAGGCRS